MCVWNFFFNCLGFRKKISAAIATTMLYCVSVTLTTLPTLNVRSGSVNGQCFDSEECVLEVHKMGNF